MKSVAIQGARGSYSEEAANQLFGDSMNIQGYSSFFETFEAVLLKNVDYAVVPLKNTIVGDISPVVEIFKQTNLRIAAELSLKIEHVLAGTDESDLGGIETVRSHSVALKQCRSFFEANPEIKQTVDSDTASSIRRIVDEGKAENGAIGSYRAARIYGARVLLENLTGNTDNETTFCLIENKKGDLYAGCSE